MLLQIPKDVSVELIFVDNDSRDQTVAIITAALQRLPIQGRVVVEYQRGAAATRMRGLYEAKGKYVAFLDDDNLPRENWLVVICDAIHQYPQASALSGRIRSLTTASIPPYAKPYLAFYAIIDRGNQPFRYDQTPKKILPPGAGLILERAHTINLLKSGTLRLAGPVSKDLYFKGEDIELLIRLQSQGGQIWYCPDIVIDHALSKDRFTSEYLFNFLKAVARPRHYHRLLRLPRYWWLPATGLYGANDLRQWIAHLLCYENSLDWRLRHVFCLYLLASPIYTLRILKGHSKRAVKESITEHGY